MQVKRQVKHQAFDAEDVLLSYMFFLRSRGMQVANKKTPSRDIRSVSGKDMALLVSMQGMAG